MIDFVIPMCLPLLPVHIYISSCSSFHITYSSSDFCYLYNFVFKCGTIVIVPALIHYCRIKLADYIRAHSGCFSLQVLWKVVLIYTHYCMSHNIISLLNIYYSFPAVVPVGCSFCCLYSFVLFFINSDQRHIYGSS